MDTANPAEFSDASDYEDDDLINDLIEHNEAFRAMLARSAASPRKPFRPLTTETP